MEQGSKNGLVRKWLSKARKRKRIPLSRIRPRLFDRKARVTQQRAKGTVGELVAVLGMDGFKGRELNIKLRRGVFTH